MRQQSQIETIKNRITDPYSVENFLLPEEIDHLILLFEKVYEGKIHKNTGPITLNIDPYIDDVVFKKIINSLTDLIGPFDVNACFFFSTDYPHIIHNDDTFDLNDVYKGITIPLKTYGSDQVPDLCFFDQYYFHGPAKFFNGDADIPTYYNKQLYDYNDVDGVSNGMIIDESTRCTYLTHLKYKWLEGLTLWGTIKWKPGTAIIFDSVRLHCASDFRKLGIKSKLGISIFTRKK